MSKPAVIPLTVWSVEQLQALLKPALPGTSMSTPGTMKTSGERRSSEPTRPPTTPTASAATNTAACVAEERSAELVRAEREHGRAST